MSQKSKKDEPWRFVESVIILNKNRFSKESTFQTPLNDLELLEVRIFIQRAKHEPIDLACQYADK